MILNGSMKFNVDADSIKVEDGGNYVTSYSPSTHKALIEDYFDGAYVAEPENNGKDGIVLENTNGKLVISKESLENLIASVIKDIPGADTVSSKTILDRDKNLIVYVTAVVSKDVMIKDISNELQEKIKTAMKRTADLDVKEVNIKIKNYCIFCKTMVKYNLPNEFNIFCMGVFYLYGDIIHLLPRLRKLKS